MTRVPTNRAPTHPGELLREDFLVVLGLSRRELATRPRLPYGRVTRLVRMERPITVDTALRLARLFGTSSEFWLNGQLAWDLYHAAHSPAAREIEQIEPVAA